MERFRFTPAIDYAEDVTAFLSIRSHPMDPRVAADRRSVRRRRAAGQAGLAERLGVHHDAQLAAGVRVHLQMRLGRQGVPVVGGHGTSCFSPYTDEPHLQRSG